MEKVVLKIPYPILVLTLTGLLLYAGYRLLGPVFDNYDAYMNGVRQSYEQPCS